jgi:hypothetical protein
MSAELSSIATPIVYVIRGERPVIKNGSARSRQSGANNSKKGRVSIHQNN